MSADEKAGIGGMDLCFPRNTEIYGMKERFTQKALQRSVFLRFLLRVVLTDFSILSGELYLGTLCRNSI